MITVKYYKSWSCQKVCEALPFLSDNIYIRFGSKLYRQIVGIPMGTNCAPLVADLFLFLYEKDFMLSLSDDNQSKVIEAFNSTSRYLDDLIVRVGIRLVMAVRPNNSQANQFYHICSCSFEFM